MKNLKLKFYFHTNIAEQTVDVYLMGEDTNGNKYRALPAELVFKQLDWGQVSKPTFRFEGSQSDQFFPALVAALAESGYTYESSDKGELKAKKEHLSDMRSQNENLWKALSRLMDRS